MSVVTSEAPVTESAVEHATAAVPVTAPEKSAGEVLQSMAGRRFDSARDVAVCTEGSLVGMITIESLLAAEADTPVGELMDPDPPTVAPGVDREVAAWHMIHHGGTSMAVVDDGGGFVGLIPPGEMLEVLLREHEEDLRRLGGFLHDTAEARLASSEPIGRRLAHRLPWLLVGLVGAFVSAIVLRGFEERLDERVALAFFIPGIVYLAGAVGTQTETLVVRGLSVGVGIRSIIWREFLTGGLVALLLAGVAFPFAFWMVGDSSVAWAVGLAVLASCATATLTGVALPRALSAAGQDPAFGSGPLVTIIQDLLSITVYLGLAVAVT